MFEVAVSGHHSASECPRGIIEDAMSTGKEQEVLLEVPHKNIGFDREIKCGLIHCE